jgi:hypothetical protein
LKLPPRLLRLPLMQRSWWTWRRMPLLLLMMHLKNLLLQLLPLLPLLLLQRMEKHLRLLLR